MTASLMKIIGESPHNDMVQFVEILSCERKTNTRLSCIVNTMATDDLVTQGARASAAAMVVT